MKQTKQNRWGLIIFAVIVFAIIILFSRNAALSEWYMSKIYPFIALVLSSVSGIFPFSLYDIFIVIIALYLFKLILFVIIKRNGFREFIYSFISLVTLLVAWFYFGWGISYFREDFYSRTNFEETTFNAENLKDFTIRFIADANDSYVDFDVIVKDGVRTEVEKSYKQISEPLKIDYPNGNRKVKRMIFESMFTKMSISGYFGPFFNEVHVNNHSLNFTYPFTLAHEMAHQFGIAQESEANLYAFLVCINSSDERIRYSAYVSTISHLLNDVRSLLPEDYEELANTVRPEIIADLRRNSEHWLSERNKTLSNAQSKAYDAYLKGNRVSSGRENYSEVVGLLISSYNDFAAI